MVVAQVQPPEMADTTRFLEEVSARTAGVSRLEMCIQCGTCGGSCPSADDMDHTPRMLFAMIRAGMKDEALRSNTPWMCVSCYHGVFVGQVETFGRSWELGLTARHYLRHFILRLPRMTPMAIGLFMRGRIGIMPHRIHQRKQLHAILSKADELEKVS